MGIGTNAMGPLKGLEGLYRDNGKEHGKYYLGFRV